MSEERDRAYFRGGDWVLEHLIEHCGMFPNQTPCPDKTKEWLMEARSNFITMALESGWITEEELKED